jgi:hypothetical protein
VKKLKSMKPKILLYDIEVTPNELYAWPEARKYDLRALRFKKRWEVLSIAYMWLGDKKVHVMTREGEKTDKALLVRFKSILEGAHVAVTHNGKRSDAPRIRTRLSFHKIKPFLHAYMVDTCEVARRNFAFDGNSLEDLADFFGIGRKLPHPGLDMWLGCMAGDRASWRKMAKYNVHDVSPLLLGVYKRLRPWVENHPSLALVKHGDRLGCPACASTEVKCDGVRPTSAYVKQRMSCKSCGQPYTVPMSLAKKLGLKGRR